MAQKRKRDPRRTGQPPQRRTGNSNARRSASNPTGQRRRPAQSRSGSGNVENGKIIDFASGRQNAQRQRRPDNSIEFPQQTRRPSPNGRQSRARTQSDPNRNRPRSKNVRAAPNRTKDQQRRPPNGRMRPTEANLRDPRRRERKKRRKLTRAAIRRRRIMRRLTAFALLLCVITAGVYLTVTMLFKITVVEVQTADGAVVQEAGGYSSEQILQALDVHPEENIFSFDPGKKSEELEKDFPMLEFIRVERKYPGTVVVRVTETQAAYAMQVQDGWLSLSGSLKILSKDSAQPTNLPTLYGGEPVSTAPGDQLDFETEAVRGPESGSDSAASSEAAPVPADQRLESLTMLLQSLESHGLLADVTRIEFADPEEMAFLYQNRISVLLGTLNELEYKLKMAEYVLLDQDGKGCASTDTGLLDLSHLSASTTRKFRFAQGEPTLPSGYTVPEQSAAPEADSSAEPAAGAEESANADAAPADAAADQTPTTPDNAAQPAADETETQNTNPE